jgi:hypothetical protein
MLLVMNEEKNPCVFYYLFETHIKIIAIYTYKFEKVF